MSNTTEILDLGYPIYVGELGSARKHGLHKGLARIVVLADANVAGYAERVTRDPQRLKFISIRLGERRKRLATVEEVLAQLTRSGADRMTAIIGVGGGVASDLFGLAAALFMRGVPYGHIATSLVAMVDASIGGKTGVDLAAGKNLAGSFNDPAAVFADLSALRILPFREVRAGLAETVKHAIIRVIGLFSTLESVADEPFARWPWRDIVADAIRVKTSIVAGDPLERGPREVLNLGHTFGHAIERGSSYRVAHGAAVAIGLRAAGLLALRTGRFSREEHARVLDLMRKLKLPLWTAQDPARIFEAMSADKKKRGGKLRFVLPRAIGDVEYGVEVSPRDVRAVLAQIVRPPGAREFR